MPVPGSWQAVVFDFDGTLARLNIDFSAMRAALRELISAYPIPAEGIMHLHILEMIEAAATLIAGRNPDASVSFLRAAQALITEREIEAAQKGALFDGTKGLLEELRRRSIRTGVVTRNCRAAVLKVFPDIDRYCQAVLTREDPRRVKPHPDHLLDALTLLGVPPVDAAMVGDHPMDISLGRRTGTSTIGVLTGHSDRNKLREAQADFIIPNAPSLLDILP